MRDSSFPREGMYFSDARKRAVRIAKNPKIDNARKNQLVSSLINQARLHEGEGAATEIGIEINQDVNNHSLPKVGYTQIYSRNYDKIFK